MAAQERFCSAPLLDNAFLGTWQCGLRRLAASTTFDSSLFTRTGASTRRSSFSFTQFLPSGFFPRPLSRELFYRVGKGTLSSRFNRKPAQVIVSFGQGHRSRRKYTWQLAGRPVESSRTLRDDCSGPQESEDSLAMAFVRCGWDSGGFGVIQSGRILTKTPQLTH